MTQHNRAKSAVFVPTGKLQFGVFFQGVNSGTIWKAAESGSQTDFESFRRIAQTAERGLFAGSCASPTTMTSSVGRVSRITV